MDIETALAISVAPGAHTREELEAALRELGDAYDRGTVAGPRSGMVAMTQETYDDHLNELRRLREAHACMSAYADMLERLGLASAARAVRAALSGAPVAASVGRS